MALSTIAIRNAKPKAKPYKLNDEKGLFLLVQPSGGMLWRFKYRVDGSDADGNPKRVEKKLGLGTFPDVSLKEVRELRDQARALLAKGIDPAEKKRRDAHAAKVSAANTFSAVAEAFIAKNERDGLAANTIIKRRWFTRLLQRSIGNRPISELQPFDVLEAVRPFEAAKNDEKAHRTLQFIGSVFRYAVANQIAPSDPTRDLRGALAKRRPKHFAAIFEPSRVGELPRLPNRRAADRGDLSLATTVTADQALRDKELQLAQAERDIAEQTIALELLTGAPQEIWTP